MLYFQSLAGQICFLKTCPLAAKRAWYKINFSNSERGLVQNQFQWELYSDEARTKSGYSICTSEFFVGFCYESSPPARIAGADRIRCRVLFRKTKLTPFQRYRIANRENLVTRNLELNLEDKRRAENQICFQKADFLSSLVQMLFQEFKTRVSWRIPCQEFSELSGSRGYWERMRFTISADLELKLEGLREGGF